MDTSNLIQTILIIALPVILAITVHEAAHGYAARRFGDDTAWKLGRVTLNPIKHIDPVGTILMPVALYLMTSGTFLFGYAKPVPVDFSRLRHPKRDMIWVALAGPASNFVQALLWSLAIFGLLLANMEGSWLTQMARAGLVANLVIWAFNLFPLPPLDGGRILAGLLPRGRPQEVLARIEPYGIFIVLGLMLAQRLGQRVGLDIPNLLYDGWMTPLMDAGAWVITTILAPLFMLMH